MQVVLQEQEKFNNSSRLEIIPFSLRVAASVNRGTVSLFDL